MLVHIYISHYWKIDTQIPNKLEPNRGFKKLSVLLIANIHWNIIRIIPHLLTAKQLFSWTLSAHYGPIAMNWTIQYLLISLTCELLQFVYYFTYYCNRIFVVVPMISIKLWCVQNNWLLYNNYNNISIILVITYFIKQLNWLFKKDLSKFLQLLENWGKL